MQMHMNKCSAQMPDYTILWKRLEQIQMKKINIIHLLNNLYKHYKMNSYLPTFIKNVFKAKYEISCIK